MIVTLRDAQPQDRDFAYRLRSEPSTRAQSFNPDWSTLEEHAKWWAEKVPIRKEGPWAVSIIQKNGSDVGMLTLDARGGICEIGIAVWSSERGQGIAAMALCLLPKEIPLLAVVKPSNVASQRTFVKAGFRRISTHVWVRP